MKSRKDEHNDLSGATMCGGPQWKLLLMAASIVIQWNTI